MLKRVISGIMLIMLLAGMLPLVFNIQQVKAVTGTTIAVVNPETGGNEFSFFTKNTLINSTFIANITVMNCSFLACWQINITWDPTLLNVTSMDDLLLPSDNVFGIYTDVVLKKIGNGTLFFAVGMQFGAPEYVNVTYGALCQIRFTIIRNDTGGPLSCNIHFIVGDDLIIPTILVNPDAYRIPFTPQDGTYKLLFPSHDIGITSVVALKTIVGQGFNLSINVTISNYGNNTENFNVTAYANTTIIQKQNVTLASFNSTTITLTWNTSGFARAYAISVNATPLEGEADLSDNQFTDGILKVSCLGDVNGDYRTDMLDYQRVKRAVDSVLGSPNWNPNADFNDDLTVDTTDFQTVKDNIPSYI